MAPYGGVANSLPVLNKLFQWFMTDYLKIEGGLFRFHHKATSLLILIGFVFISFENFLDTKSIVCFNNNNNPFAKQFCWMHGHSYISSHLQGLATGCYVDQTDLASDVDAPVTNYYIWLPYMLSLIFLITKLPHILWKKFFENNLIRHLLGGEESWQELIIGPRNNGGGDGNNDGNGKKDGDNNNQQGQGKGKKKKDQGNQCKRFKVWKSSEIGKQFAENRWKFTMYQYKYAAWESFNIVTILASVQITDWILNSQFWSYGWEVIQYLNSYQDRSLQLHDPMCQVFPTEVGCRYRVGVGNGFADEVNLLCILGNNIFNQKYFFALWLWWMVLLVISVVGVIFRLLRIAFPAFSKMLLLRKVHGSQLRGLILTSGEYFVLELLLDNLTHVPAFSDAVLAEIAANMKEISYERLRSQSFRDWMYHDFKDDAPLLKKEDVDLEKYDIPEKELANGDANMDQKSQAGQANTEGSQDKVCVLNETKSTSKKKKNKKNVKVDSFPSAPRGNWL